MRSSCEVDTTAIFSDDGQESKVPTTVYVNGGVSSQINKTVGETADIIYVPISC